MFWKQVFHVDKDGKHYNYKKEGTTEIRARSEAEVREVTRQRATLIHGLGAGGNVPAGQPQPQPSQHQRWQQRGDSDTPQHPHEGPADGRSGGGSGSGRCV